MITVESTGVDVKELVVDKTTVSELVKDESACIEVFELEDAATGTAGVCIVVKVGETTVELQADVEVDERAPNDPQELCKKLAFL